jgi:cystathionine beta-lyase/cystathionine gamma-synthase
LGVAVTWVDPSDVEAVGVACTPATRLVYVESPSNPMLNIAPLRALGDLAMAQGVELWIDGTFASPVLQRPLDHGATLVLHSGTKFLSGHSDVMCGAAAGSAEVIARLRRMQILLGTVLAPDAAWLLLRGLRTIGVRVPRQSDTAFALAQFLVTHAAVAEVRYPLLAGDQGLSVAREQMRGGGGVITFRLHGERRVATAFLERLRLITIATSLGGIESVIELPFDLDFVDDKVSVPAWIRLSVGLEEVEDLRADLQQALP